MPRMTKCSPRDEKPGDKAWLALSCALGLGLVLAARESPAVEQSSDTTAAVDVERGALALLFSPTNQRPLPGVKSDLPLGVLVIDVVPGGPAEQAGVANGDYLIRLNGKGVKTVGELNAASESLEAGKATKIAIKRQGDGGTWQTQILEVTPISAVKAKEMTAAHLQKQRDAATAAARRQRDALAAKQAEQERALLARPPFEIQETWLVPDAINQPTLKLSVRNNRDQVIDAYEVTVHCFTKFGDPVKGLRGTNTYNGIAQSVVPPKSTVQNEWQLSWHSATGLARVRVERVKLSDGTVWTPAEENEGWVEAKMK